MRCTLRQRLWSCTLNSSNVHDAIFVHHRGHGEASPRDLHFEPRESFFEEDIGAKCPVSSVQLVISISHSGTHKTVDQRHQRKTLESGFEAHWHMHSSDDDSNRDASQIGFGSLMCLILFSLFGLERRSQRVGCSSFCRLRCAWALSSSRVGLVRVQTRAIMR